MIRPEPPRSDEVLIERKLREVVRRHFPAGDRKDEFSGDLFHEWLGDELVMRAWENPYSFLVFEKPKALAALERIDRALAELGAAFSEAEIQPRVGAGLFGQMALGTLGIEGGKAFLKVAGQAPVYRSAVQKFARDLEVDSNGKRTLAQFKAKEIGLVPGCRTVWWYGTGKPAPLKDLNRGTKFAKFLADVIEACGLDGDEVAAFRGWVREQKSSPYLGQE